MPGQNEHTPYWLAQMALDRQVAVKATWTGTVTYWQLPFPDITIDTIIWGGLGAFGNPMFLFKPPLRQAKDGNGHTLADLLIATGDYTNNNQSTCHVAGRRFLYLIEPTRPYARDDRGRPDTVRKRLWVQNLAPSHRETGSYVVRRRRPALRDAGGTVTVPIQDIVGRFAHPMPGVAYEGSHVQWAAGGAHEVCYTIEDETPKPVKIVALDWLTDQILRRMA